VALRHYCARYAITTRAMHSGFSKCDLSNFKIFFLWGGAVTTGQVAQPSTPRKCFPTMRARRSRDMRDPFEGESLDSQGLPKPVVTLCHRRRTGEQVLLNGLQRLRNEVARPDTTDHRRRSPPSARPQERGASATRPSDRLVLGSTGVKATTWR
jgi:hypothetical protein